MKKIFLTSSMGTSIKIDGKRVPCKIDNSNNMINILKESLPIQERLIVIVSDPKDFERSDLFHQINKTAFEMSGFSFNEIITIDNRNKSDVKQLVQGANLIILGGGHVPTQNKWFKEIKLKKLLKEYNGIIVGMSAGAINCADIVYSCPEWEGEAIDPNYNKWIEGLCLTDIKIFPHFNERITEELDGLRIKDDIIIPDSFKYPIYALNDGSFIEVNEKEKIIYGDCYKIYNGVITKICDNENIKNI